MNRKLPSQYPARAASTQAMRKPVKYAALAVVIAMSGMTGYQIWKRANGTASSTAVDSAKPDAQSPNVVADAGPPDETLEVREGGAPKR